jgi:hypothetical protein
MRICFNTNIYGLKCDCTNYYGTLGETKSYTLKFKSSRGASPVGSLLGAKERLQ